MYTEHVSRASEGRRVSNWTAAIMVIAIMMGPFFGMLLDYAIRQNIQEWADRKWRVRIGKSNWGEDTLVGVFKFCDGYLTFIFGADVRSPRLFVICLADALVATGIAFGYAIHSTNFTWKLVIVAIVFGALDAASLIISRTVIKRVVKRAEPEPGKGKGSPVWPVFQLVIIAYFTMGAAWCVLYLLVSAGVFGPTTPIDAAGLLLAFFIWLPSLIYYFVIRHDPLMSKILIAALPSALTTMILIFVLALPALFVLSLPHSERVAIYLLARLKKMPRGTGLIIGLISSFVLAIFSIIQYFKP